MGKKGSKTSARKLQRRLGRRLPNIGVSGLSELSRMIHGAEYRDNLVLYSTVLHCTVLYCTVHYCTVYKSTVLYRFVECNIVIKIPPVLSVLSKVLLYFL